MNPSGTILSPTKIGSFNVKSVNLRLADFVRFKIEGQVMLGLVNGMERFPERTIASIEVLGYSNDGKIKMPTIPPRPGDYVYHANEALIRSVLHSPENGIYIGLLRNHKIRVKISPDILLKRHLTIMAQTGGGKSYTAGVIMEELMLRRYPVIVIDVANEYGRMLYPNQKMEKWKKFKCYPRGFPDKIDTITKWDKSCYKLIKPGRMLIINLKNTTESDQPAIVRDICDDMFEWRSAEKKRIPPCFLVIEEVHKFAPQRREICSTTSVNRVLTEGRKYKLGCCLITQRPSRIDKTALSQCWTQILHKVTNRNDLEALEKSAERAPSNFRELLQTLSQGEALIIGGGLSFTAVAEIRERMSDAK